MEGARNQISGVDDTRADSASHPTREGHGPTEEGNKRNRTPSRAALVAASPREELGGKGVNESGRGGGSLPGSLAGGLRTCGDASRERLRLETLTETLRQTLRVARGQVLDEYVIEDRARNGAQAVAYALEAFEDEDI